MEGIVEAPAKVEENQAKETEANLGSDQGNLAKKPVAPPDGAKVSEAAEAKESEQKKEDKTAKPTDGNSDGNVQTQGKYVEALEQAANALKDKDSALLAAQEQAEAAQKQLAQLQKQMEETTAAHTKKLELEAAQRKAAEEKQAELIKQNEEKAFQKLQGFLSSSGKDINNASKSDLVNLTLEQMQQQKQELENGVNNNKRTRELLKPFNVPDLQQMGTVNASAAEYGAPATKRCAMEAQHMHEYRKNNPNALFSEINREFKHVQRAVNTQGIVNANKQQWGISHTEECHKDEEDLSAKQLYPAFFEMMSGMNNGRLPHRNDASDYVNRIQKPDPNVRMRY